MPQRSLFLTFGKVSDPRQAFLREGAEVLSRGQRLGRQVAVIEAAGAAIRLNSRGWMAAPPQLVAALPDRAALRLLCRDRIEAMTPAFSAGARRWTAEYLDRAEDAAGPPETALRDIEAPSDRFFATLLPLPAVHVAVLDASEDASGGGSEDGSGGGYGGGSGGAPGPFTALDLALWDGRRLTGVLFGGGATVTPGRQAALDRLAGRAGSLLALHRIDTPTEGTALARRLIAAAETPQPWFGPYRAEGFHAALP